MTIKTWGRKFLLLVPILSIALTSCGSDDTEESSSNQPSIVVSTNILGDVVTELVGDQADVLTIMPVGADPHDFQASAQEVKEIVTADAFIVNGANFEDGLLDTIGSAKSDGVATFETIEVVETIEFGAEGHEGHDDEHKDEDSHEGHGHEEGDIDPHFFTDPARMADAVQGISDFLEEEVDGLDAAKLEAATDAYITELETLDSEVAEQMSLIPEENRVLITNHEVFGYFADRYDFTVIGTVVPNGTTAGNTNAGDLADLTDLIQEEEIPAIFVDISSSSELAQTLTDDVNKDIAVVELYTESLSEAGSEGDTYLKMVETNASRISASLS